MPDEDPNVMEAELERKESLKKAEEEKVFVDPEKFDDIPNEIKELPTVNEEDEQDAAHCLKNLEALLGDAKRKHDRDRHKKKSRRSRSHSASDKRSRRRSRSPRRRRSRSPHRSNSPDRRDVDKYGNPNRAARGDNRHHRSNEDERGRQTRRKELPLEPLVGDIYQGRITNILAFGAVVQIEGLRKRWEGLVHVSQLRREGRVANVADVVQRGQKV
ncbi:unnamed protein product [Protopolystoma xenopodis]|uniref:S1 motif domain-containing protein n=1 Tax=Protopolystoma xenopodis TaxID=117903 RepID=A0A3S5AMF8_9PLAT|nr:unnamed protein product [Protopolystoma xenopodis]